MYWITAVLGATLTAAPFLLGYSNNNIALWTSLTLGVGVVLASIVEYLSQGKDRKEYWFMAIIGLLAVGAPLVLNFAGVASAFWITVGVGALLTVIAGSKLFYDKESFG